jgi:hypothetical protein
MLDRVRTQGDWEAWTDFFLYDAYLTILNEGGAPL